MTNEKVAIIRRELGQLFRHAHQGRASVSLLYNVGEKLGSRLQDVQEGVPKELSDALEFIHGLHDIQARSYSALNREQIYYYMRQLSQ